VRQLADSNGFVSDTYAYTAFGEPLASTGSIANEFRYVGEQADPNSGFYYLRARWMDPATGRFLGVDPVAGKKTSPLTLHRYLYAGGSPVSFEDPSGRFFTLSGVLTGIAVYGITQAIHYTISHFYYLGGKRPDDDGRITFIEAGLWWKHGDGKPLSVPLSSVDLTGITREDFWRNGEFSRDRKFNLLSPSHYSSFDDGMVYGTLNLSLGAGTSVVETDGGDDYDFDPNLDLSLGILHFLGRNAETVGAAALHGFGKKFRINLTGTGHISE
jgi:RHS repeat-associated protein